VATAIPLLRAPILAGVTHAFTTRRGGVSDGPFATLNLGRGAGDDPACVAENRRRALAALGVDLAGHVEATQVHGTAVAVVTRADAGTAVEGADGLLTADAAVTLAVHAADCVPILLWDPRRGAVGAVHAGWRGTAAGIGGAAVAAMVRAFGTDPGDLRVALGPAIGPDHYEVGPEVVAAFQARPWARAVVRPGRGDRAFLDLWEANRRELIAAGVPPAQIWVSRRCTACHPAWWFSYRRDGTTGRQAGLISPRRSPRPAAPAGRGGGPATGGDRPPPVGVDGGP